MKQTWIGCGQLTWKNMDEAQILAEIALAGYDGAPASPRRGETTAQTLARFEQAGLKPAPGYLGAEFWRVDQEAEILARAEQYADFAQAADCTELYVAAGGGGYVTARGLTRWQISGHVQPADSLSDDEYRQFAKVLNRVGAIMLERGVSACFHNHVGTVIETKVEIDRLWDMVDHSKVFMGPDTGHLAWGGVDVASFCREYASAIKTMHIKDIDPTVLAEGREKNWDYRTFSDQGIFTELGRGFVDFPTVFKILEKVNFQGWLIVETDVTQQPTPLLSAQISRDYLTSLGY
ncbi:MAG: TIM barrel protein [Caldilineaceae bacterium]|nr:TIM barrel protein [Caldilineaceae bacterium]